MIFISIILIFTALLQTVSAEMTAYDIVATYNDDLHQIEGSEAVTFTNSSTTEVSELYIFLYPNHYAIRDSNLNLGYYRKVYPVTFDPGKLNIVSIEGEDGIEIPFSPLPFHEDEIIVLRLPRPILPQESIRFFARFLTTIPQKFGVFGYYGDLVTLQGGWHPYLAPFEEGEWMLNKPPPKSHFRVRLSLKRDFKVAGSASKTIIALAHELQTVTMEAERIPFFSLTIGRHLTRSKTVVGPVHLTRYALKKNSAYARQIEEILQPALVHFLEHTGPLPPIDIVLSEAYLHQDLTATGTNILYLNNQLFKVFPTLKRFHRASLVAGLYQVLWRHKRPDEEFWVIEALARQDADRFMDEKYGKTSSLSKGLKPLSFIPVIDQILYSESLPLRQVYFREAVPPLVSEDIRFYNNPSSENANIFPKLQTLMGIVDFAPAVALYRNQDENDGPILPFRTLLFESSQQDMNPLIDLWLSQRSKIDFGIEAVEHMEIEGGYRTEISITKQGEGIEPLQIVALQKNGSDIPATWDGTSNFHRLVIDSASPITSVELDPNKFTNDPVRKNNRLPRDWKVLVDNINFNYDFQTHDFSYQAGLFFQYLYDTDHWLRILFSHTTTGDLSHIAYTQTVKKNHLLTTGFTFETLEPSLGNTLKEEAGYLSLGYSFIFPDLPLMTESARRFTNAFPAFNVGLVYNQQVTGDRSDYALSLALDFRRAHAFSHYHEISGRVLIGQSIGELFENRRFSLGGTNAMRGYSPLIFEGENMSLFSLEYRFALFYETDINLLGLAHTHTWQGAIFSDTGMVGPTHDVFRPNQFLWDAGVGIRFFIDLFGVYPSIVRFDVAMPIDSPIQSEDKLHYYLNAGQSF